MAQPVRPIIAVDCDHVVMDINEGLRKFVNEKYDESHTAADYQVAGEYRRYWERVWGLDDGVKSDRFSHFIASGKMRELDAVPDSISTLRQVKDKYDLVMVTARSEFEVAYTNDWLDQHAPGLFNAVAFMFEWEQPHSKVTKADICQKLGATYLIDDNYDHCRIASELGIHTLLFGDYGWNREVIPLGNMTQVHDWLAVRRFFDE